MASRQENPTFIIKFHHQPFRFIEAFIVFFSSPTNPSSMQTLRLHFWNFYWTLPIPSSPIFHSLCWNFMEVKWMLMHKVHCTIFYARRKRSDRFFFICLLFSSLNVFLRWNSKLHPHPAPLKTDKTLALDENDTTQKTPKKSFHFHFYFLSLWFRFLCIRRKWRRSFESIRNVRFDLWFSNLTDDKKSSESSFLRRKRKSIGRSFCDIFNELFFPSYKQKKDWAGKSMFSEDHLDWPGPECFFTSPCIFLLSLSSPLRFVVRIIAYLLTYCWLLCYVKSTCYL